MLVIGQLSHFKLIQGSEMVHWLAMLPEFNATICVEFACSPYACVCSLQVLQLTPTVQRHVIVILNCHSCEWLCFYVLALRQVGDLSREKLTPCPIG